MNVIFNPHIVEGDREVFLIILMNELPRLGRATTIASGITIRRSVCQVVIPTECAASRCPASTLSMDARMYSEKYEYSTVWQRISLPHGAVRLIVS